MDAVLGVDLQAVGVVFVLDELVHAGRAVAGFGAGVFGQVDADGDGGVLQGQMRGLLLFVVGVADEDAAQAVKGQLAIGLGVDDGFALGGGLQVGVVGLVAAQRPGDVAAQHELLDAVHQGGHRQAVFEPVFEVAVFVQLGVEPAFLEGFGVGAQFIVLASCDDRVISGFCGQHAGLDGGVAALDAAHVQVAGIAANQRAAGEHGFGQGVAGRRR